LGLSDINILFLLHFALIALQMAVNIGADGKSLPIGD
jgi:hypothetical protein